MVGINPHHIQLNQVLCFTRSRSSAVFALLKQLRVITKTKLSCLFYFFIYIDNRKSSKFNFSFTKDTFSEMFRGTS